MGVALIRGARAGRLVVALEADPLARPGDRSVADRLRGGRRARTGPSGTPARLVPASFSSVLLVVLQLIALARYPGRFEWSSAAGVIYLAFLVMMLVTGGVALARARSRPGAPVP
jgi:hypothetical protein